MKRLLVDVFWPAWEWGPCNMPHMRYIAFSYSDGITTRDNNKMVRLITSPAYQRLWGDRFKMLKLGERRIENDQTGYKVATSQTKVSMPTADVDRHAGFGRRSGHRRASRTSKSFCILDGHPSTLRVTAMTNCGYYVFPTLCVMRPTRDPRDDKVQWQWPGCPPGHRRQEVRLE